MEEDFIEDIPFENVAKKFYKTKGKKKFEINI